MKSTITTIISSAVLLTLFAVSAIACGNGNGNGPATSTSAASQPRATASPSFTYEGETDQIVRALAMPDEFSGQRGITVLLFAGPHECAETYLFDRHVEVFFPEAGDGYGAPISVDFVSGEGSNLQEYTPAGYTGSLSVSPDGTLSGMVDIDGVGFDGDSSVAASFTVGLCS